MDRTDPSKRGISGFIAELRRRHVVRAGLAYAAGGFVVLQAAEIVQQAWAFPEWVLRLVVVFTLLGFPLVLAFAWVYEITPLGLRTTRELDGDRLLPETGRLPRVAFLVVTVTVVSLSGWWWVRSNVGEVAAVPGAAFPASAVRREGDPIRSLAVLPFESFSPEPGRDYFAEGMHEALISQLGQLDFLRVLSRTSASQYDKTGKSAPQIGSELGVDALIEGSVLLADGRVRISVQLIDAANDRHLWSNDYERDLVDIIALQREVARAVVEELRGELSPDPLGDRIAAAAPSIHPEAAEALMKGRMALADATGGAAFASAALDSAAQSFALAIEYDPDVAAAYSGLAQVFVIRALDESGGGRAELLADARARALQALALDPNDREIQEVLGYVEMLAPEASESGASPPAEGGTPASGADPELRTEAADPEEAMFSVTEPGRQLEIAWARREAESDEPDAQVRAARRFAWAGMHEQAREILQQVVRIDPQNAQAWEELEHVHRMLGDLGGVVNVRRDRMRQDPEAPRQPGAPPPPAIAELQEAVERDSVAGYWQWRLAELEARQDRGEPVSPVHVATAHAALGNVERALELLEDGVEARDPRLRGVRWDPAWDALRRHPAFTALLARVGRMDPPGAPSGRRGAMGPQGPGGDDGREREGASDPRGRGPGEG